MYKIKRQTVVDGEIQETILDEEFVSAEDAIAYIADGEMNIFDLSVIHYIVKL